MVTMNIPKIKVKANVKWCRNCGDFEQPTPKNRCSYCGKMMRGMNES